jgi:hypothetical protein
MSGKDRGALLTAWLILMLVANVFTMLMYFFLSLSSFGRLMFLPRIEMWTIYIFCFLGAFNLVCVCFLFLWKKWTFFGLCGSAAIALVVNLYVGVGFFAFVGLAGVVISYLVLRPKWNLLDNF